MRRKMPSFLFNPIEAPWGDYGRILYHGMSMHEPRLGGKIRLERTGPEIFPITFPIDIIVTADFRRGGHGIERRALQLGIVVFGYYKNRHDQITLASFLSFSTSVATSGTVMPAERAGGSETLRVFRRGATSTPRSSGVTISRAFFLAFMMLGRVT